MHYSVTCLAKMHAIPRQTSGRDVRCCGVEGHHVRVCPPPFSPPHTAASNLWPPSTRCIQSPSNRRAAAEAAAHPWEGEPWEMLLIVPQTFFFFFLKIIKLHQPTMSLSWRGLSSRERYSRPLGQWAIKRDRSLWRAGRQTPGKVLLAEPRSQKRGG